MGEAKRRKLKEGNAFEQLDRALRQLGIETAEFGFYDLENFLRAEQADPSFLEQYARWVMLSPRDDAYTSHVRDVVPRLTEMLAATLQSDGMEGRCVAAAGMMTRMLDRLGVWCFGVAGCLTLEVKSRGLWRGLATVDDLDFPGAALGHSWVVAPPYHVADASLLLQRWGSDPIREYIPSAFLIEGDYNPVTPDMSDVVSARVRARHAERQGRPDPELHHRLEPRLREFGRSFPALDAMRDDLRLRYVPVAIRQTDVPLELINTEGRVGRPAIEVWREVIAPAFGVES